MQESVQRSAAAIRFGVLLAVAHLLFVLYSGKLYAGPYASAWDQGQNSSLRLIAAGRGPSQGVYRAGVEIRLKPGALTYWRMPGSAGAPPVFSFEGSVNLKDAEVLYPAPERFEEEGSEVFGYRGQVIFPLRVAAADPSRPVRLTLRLSYAVCAKICLPVEGNATLDLEPSGQGNSAGGVAGAEALSAAEALVPHRLTPQERDTRVTVTPESAGPVPSWRLSLRQSGSEDVFAEGPPGWYIETKKIGPDEYLLKAVEKPPEEEEASVAVTVKDKRQSYEFVAALGLPATSEESAGR